jgi:lipid A 4'-phosphatase
MNAARKSGKATEEPGAEQVTPRRLRKPGAAWGAGWAVRLIAIGLLLAVLFRLVPWIDMEAAGIFYRPNGGFWLADSGFARFWHQAMPWLRNFVLLAFAVWAGLWIWRRRPPRGVSAKAVVLIALSLALGPGLLVNVVFKDNWGRPRPVQMQAFGGSERYVAPFVPSTACRQNCSFPAGHPAFFFGFFALALALRRRPARQSMIGVVTVVGAMAGVGRMMQGKHFLSDVIFSGLFCYLVAWILFAALYEWRVVARWRLRDRLAALAHWLARLRVGEVRLPALIRPDVSQLSTESGGTLALIAVMVTVAFTMGVIDVPLALWLKSVEASSGLDLFRWLAPLGLGWPWIFALVVALAICAMAAERSRDGTVAALWRRRACLAGFVLTCILVAGLVANILQPLFGRARPRELFADGTTGLFPGTFDVDFWSMPSGHATTIIALATALIMLRPRLAFPAIVFAVLVAASRVALTVHYLTDVLVAAVITVPICFLVRAAFRDFQAGIFPEPKAPAGDGSAGHQP